MDVIALARAGFANAVAPLGTALTADQLRLIWAMSALPTLCFDGDSAGRKAAHRAIDTALPFLEPGRSLQFTFLPEGRDPDDMVSGGARDALARLIAEPLPFIDVLWAREAEKHPLDTPEQRASFEARLTEAAQKIEHKSLRFHYMSAFREKLRSIGHKSRNLPAAVVDDETWRTRSMLAKPNVRRVYVSGRSQAVTRTSAVLSTRLVQATAPVTAPREALIIVALLNHPWLIDEHMEEIARIPFIDPDCNRLRDAVLTVHQADESLDIKKLLEHLSKQGYEAELERLQRACAHTADPHFAPEAEREQVQEGWHHVMMLHGKAGVPRSLQEAEADYVSDPSSENFSKLRAVVQQVEIVSS